MLIGKLEDGGVVILGPGSGVLGMLTEEHPKDGLSRAQEHEAAIFGMAKEAAAGAQED